MKKYAVGYILLLDNELTVEIIEANSFKEAIIKHSEIAKYNDIVEWINDMPNDLKEIKNTMISSEIGIDVKEI